MKSIVDLLRRIRQRGRTDSVAYAVPATEGGDRSSMADLVRILRMHDEECERPNYPK
jgi:hypothetical protein